MTQFETDVLIVGGGAAGLSASILLSLQDVNSRLVSRYPTTSNLPKATYISIKTMEILREVGLEAEVRAIATPPENMRHASYYAGFAGDGPDYGRLIARVGGWGRGGQDIDWRAASSVLPSNLMQSRLEPLMKRRAEALTRGSVDFYHSFVAMEETSQGVVATIENRASGETYRVAARYLLACDGGRVVGPQVGIAMEGHLGVATSVSIHFSADLSKHFHDTGALTCAVLNPDTGMQCVIVPMGPERWAGESSEWVVHLVSFAGDHKLFDDATAISTMKRCLGLPALDCVVHVINRWPLDAVVATQFRHGRTFVLGDAAHRMPPAGGNGLNSAIQDAYNLSWKIGAVLRNAASEDLLDSYEAERRPLAQHTVATAFTGWGKNRDLTEAIGFSAANTPERNWANLRELWAEGEVGDAVRRRVARSLLGVLPNYNSLNIAYGYVYGAGALVPDGSARLGTDDPLDSYRPQTRPGHTVPDVFVEDLQGRRALGDLVGRGRFVLIAGELGRAWCDAAVAVAAVRGFAIEAFTIGGAEGDWLDLRNDWARVRGHGPAGAILVRPDRFVAWRAQQLARNPLAVLEDVFAEILGDAFQAPDVASAARAP